MISVCGLNERVEKLLNKMMNNRENKTKEIETITLKKIDSEREKSSQREQQRNTDSGVACFQSLAIKPCLFI